MGNKPRVVLDTNVLISAIIFGGNSRTCLTLAREGRIQSITSRAILLELAQKLKQKFRWSDDDVANVVSGLAIFCDIVQPQNQLDVVKKDLPDNRILEAAVEGRADVIISGDQHHLLPLKIYQSIEILSPAEFIRKTV